MTKPSASGIGPRDGVLASHHGLASTIVAAAVQSGSEGSATDDVGDADGDVDKNADDATRTADGSVVPTPESVDPPPPGRLPAPLQTRDPERYDVLGEHGRGGLGKVARAYDKELGRQVAIKELLKRGDTGEIRFLREALITARLEHPSIVPLHEAGRWPDGTPFYVMKLVAGRSLKELLEERTTVEARLELLHHVIAVADALAYAHKRKIIHRDLKPGNVIAGDFGETIVIDWGLAKDLSATDDAAGDASPYRGPASSDLTEAGSVLGTPMYMAPEQWRGEPVDQRADVFAIGAMLWELCSLQRVPPADVRQRDRVLRKNGIDRDLAAIVAKALEPDPRRRYRDAGELARDLRAFKSGARIGARRYTPFAVIAHWTRRHRALAATIAAALVLGLVGTVSYLSVVTAERDRADRAAAVAVTAKQALILQNAELLLSKDPTAAARLMAEYEGSDVLRRKLLLAEASGRGVADAERAPHTDTIRFLATDPITKAVYSIGEDHTLRVTLAERTEIIKQDVGTPIRAAFSATTRRLAYARSPTGISVIDLPQGSTTTLDIDSVISLAISPDGTRVAALDSAGKLRIWDMASVATSEPYIEHRIRGHKITFADASRLVAWDQDKFHVLTLLKHTADIVTQSITAQTFHAETNHITVGARDGHVSVYSLALEPLATHKACMKSVAHVSMCGSEIVTFTCEDRIAGTLHFDSNAGSISPGATFATTGVATQTMSSHDCRYVAALSDSSTLYIHDSQTGITHHRTGHASSLSYVLAPSRHLNKFISGDTTGTMRIWPLPTSDARRIIGAPYAVLGAALSPNHRFLIAAGADAVIRRVDLLRNKTVLLRGHGDAVTKTRFSQDSSQFLSLSIDGTIRIWSTDSATPLRVFDRHRGAISNADFFSNGDRAASAAADGRVWLWSTRSQNLDRDVEALAHAKPLIALQVLRSKDVAVVADADGQIWEISATGVARTVAENSPISFMRSSHDNTRLLVGSTNGEVKIYNTTTYDVTKAVNLGTSIRQIEIDPMHRDAVATSETGKVWLIPLNKSRRSLWSEVKLQARDIAYSSDGDLLSIATSEGELWFYSFPDDKWTYVREHTSRITSARFSRTGFFLVSADTSGNVILRNTKR